MGTLFDFDTFRGVSHSRDDAHPDQSILDNLTNITYSLFGGKNYRVIFTDLSVITIWVRALFVPLSFVEDLVTCIVHELYKLCFNWLEQVKKENALLISWLMKLIESFTL